MDLLNPVRVSKYGTSFSGRDRAAGRDGGAGARLALIVVSCLGLVLLFVVGTLSVASLNGAYQTYVPLAIRQYLWVGRTILIDPWMCAFAVAVFTLERLIPARPGQRIFSSGLALDLCWYVLFTLNLAFVMPAYGGALRSIYDRYLSFMTVTSLAGWPMPYRIVLSFVIVDFVYWLRHYVQHKVPALWYFHAVHHGQRELNFLTDLRIHVIEYLYDSTALFVPLFIVGATIPTDLYIAAILQWYRKLYHSNLRSNYGLLKYVVVSPQYHRIHHSNDPAHIDKNFAVYFTIWDRVFGTMHRSFDEYPDTGISDPRFPTAPSGGAGAVLRTFAAEFIYPFRQLLLHFGAPKHAAPK